jgi:hypothetical protein
MKTHTEVVVCPDCGRRQSAELVDTVTPMEEAELTTGEFRKIGTVTCPGCGYWFFSPPRVSNDPSGQNQ